MSGSGEDQKIQITKYYISYLLGWCRTVDAVLGLYVNDKTVWEGEMTPNNGGFHAQFIDKQELFGGQEKEGGLQGSWYTYFGLATQLYSDGLIQKIGATLNNRKYTSNRGLLTSWFTNGNGRRGGAGFYWNANTATLPDIWQRVRRLSRLLGDATAGIQTKVDMTSDVGLNLFPRFGEFILAPGQEGVPIWDPDTQAFKLIVIMEYTDANGAQILYETLVNDDWGMRCDPALVDFGSYERAAQTLKNEGLALALLWSSEGKIGDFQEVVLAHIQATQFINPQNGKYTLKLIRGDYDVNQTMLFTPDTPGVTLSKFQRKGLGETVNEVKVSWRNPKNEQDETVSVQDLGNIAEQGAIITETKDFHGLRSPTVALMVAQRECRNASLPLASLEMTAGRSAWSLVPGDVVRVTWPEYGLLELPMRVTEVNEGTRDKSAMRLTLFEDVFSAPAGHYVSPATTKQENLSEWPRPIDYATAITLPAYMASDMNNGASEEEAYVGVFAAQESDDTARYDLLTERVSPAGDIGYVSMGRKAIGSRGLLATALVPEPTSEIAFSDVLGDGPKKGAFVMIGTGDDSTREICLISGITEAAQFTVKRGCLDTIPRAWPLDAEVWFITADGDTRDPTRRMIGGTARYKILPQTTRDTLDVMYAAVTSTVVSDRPHAPNRPSGVTANGIQFGRFEVNEDEEIDLTWRVRNRLREDARVFGWNDATMGPEAGQKTRIQVLTYGNRGIVSSVEVDGTSYTVPFEALGDGSRVILRVDSVRGDLESLQGVEFEIDIIGRTGWGEGYGESWGN